jgi:hypothetical protein
MDILAEELFQRGVSIDVLREWLGEPLAFADAARSAVWDCLNYEEVFQQIHRSVARVPEPFRGIEAAALGAASEVHLLAQCSARRVGGDRWVLERQCLKHLGELPSAGRPDLI